MPHQLFTLSNAQLGQAIDGVNQAIQEALAHPGRIVKMHADIVDRVDSELASRAVSNVIELRRQERSVSADVLALHIG